MRLSLIAAMAKNRVIGHHNRLPWHLPADLRRFKQITLGKPIVMGRRTFESIGRPLPGRKNIILTAEEHYQPKGCTVVHSMEEVLREAGGADELMVIGGASLYVLFLPHADRLYLTLIGADYEGDTFFPIIDPSEWCEIERQDFPPDENFPHPYRFVILERKNG